MNDSTPRKARTPRELWPGHHGHEALSVDLIEQLCDRLRVPNECRELAVLVAEFHGVVHKVFELRPATVLKLLERTDALRRGNRFEWFLLACEADARGRKGFEDRPYPQADFLRRARAAIKPITPGPEETKTLQGAQIGERLRRRRLKAIEQLVALTQTRKR